MALAFLTVRFSKRPRHSCTSHCILSTLDFDGKELKGTIPLAVARAVAEPGTAKLTVRVPPVTMAVDDLSARGAIDPHTRSTLSLTS
jgi:hypothetical protein